MKLEFTKIYQSERLVIDYNEESNILRNIWQMSKISDELMKFEMDESF